MNDNCRHISDLIAESMARQLTAEESAALYAHIKNCSDCSAAYRAVNNAAALIKEHNPAEEAVPETVRAAYHKKLQQEAMCITSRQRFYPRLVFAAAAVLLLMLGLGAGLYLQWTDVEKHQISQSVVAAKEPLTIRLGYTSDRAIDAVRVTIQLDEGVSFFSDEPSVNSLKEYVWEGSLIKGRNEIPFVVEVKKLGTWTIKTRAEFDGFMHRHDVELRADELNVTVTYYEYNRKRI